MLSFFADDARCFMRYAMLMLFADAFRYDTCCRARRYATRAHALMPYAVDDITLFFFAALLLMLFARLCYASLSMPCC